MVHSYAYYGDIDEAFKKLIAVPRHDHDAGAKATMAIVEMAMKDLRDMSVALVNISQHLERQR